ncbi:MAG: TraR/DksA family transcriptional regulator [Gammaproteobacteria bacterium]|nr:TraR/DksA family transcriptional regulator [Gammaproteobacteria bacterium]
MEIDLADFKARLEELAGRASCLDKQVSDTAQTVDLDQNRLGRLSRMDAMQGQAMAVASSARLQQELQRINKALLRIDTGDFGRCLECDEFIAVARLEIDPSAERCVECAKLVEKA